jgi:hypothetical protein
VTLNTTGVGPGLRWHSARFPAYHAGSGVQ